MNKYKDNIESNAKYNAPIVGLQQKTDLNNLLKDVKYVNKDCGGSEERARVSNSYLNLTYVEARIMRAINNSENGLTSHEIATLTMLEYSAVQPCTSKLRDEGFIIDSGLRRRACKSDGQYCKRRSIVWVSLG